jgi:Flp pilus assembly protein TadG
MNLNRYPRSRRNGAQHGSASVEMALIAPVLFLMLMAVFEFSIVFFTSLTMQYAVREGSRYAITGQSDRDPAASNHQRYLAIIQAIKDNSVGMYNSVNPVISVNNTTYATANSYSATMFGGPDDVVVIRLDCSWTIVTPIVGALFQGGKLNFSVATTMRNESYQP